MAQIDVPFTNEDIDTSKPGMSVRNVFQGSLGFALVFGMMSLGLWLYGMGRSVVGADEQSQQIPGV
jgi:hypothetical protein